MQKAETEGAESIAEVRNSREGAQKAQEITRYPHLATFCGKFCNWLRKLEFSALASPSQPSLPLEERERGIGAPGTRPQNPARNRRICQEPRMD
jgi:hypothetical protein